MTPARKLPCPLCDGSGLARELLADGWVTWCGCSAGDVAKALVAEWPIQEHEAQRIERLVRAARNAADPWNIEAAPTDRSRQVGHARVGAFTPTGPAGRSDASSDPSVHGWTEAERAAVHAELDAFFANRGPAGAARGRVRWVVIEPARPAGGAR